jgi:hypothetical protein
MRAMSILLEDERGQSVKIAVWSWGVIHDLVTEARVIPGPVWAPKRYNAGGALDPGQVATLADFLERQVLPRLQRGERLVCEGNAPDDGSDYEEPWKEHSLRVDELERIIAFLRSAPGSVECL